MRPRHGPGEVIPITGRRPESVRQAQPPASNAAGRLGTARQRRRMSFNLATLMLKLQIKFSEVET
jgi:hypothetical protein